MSHFNGDPPWYMHHRGRPVHDVALPGEREQVIARRIDYAQKRDGVLTEAERVVRDCTSVRCAYAVECSLMRCSHCPWVDRGDVLDTGEMYRWLTGSP